MLRFLTAGESHGAGARRHPRRHAGRAAPSTSRRSTASCAAARAATAAAGAWRSNRTAPRSCRASAHGETIGRPIALLIRNKDWENWQRTMAVDPEAPADAAGARRGPGHPAAARPRGSGRRGRSTATTICATCSSAPARARPPRAWRPAPSPASCSRSFGIDIASHVTSIGRRRARRRRPLSRSTHRRAIADDVAAAVRGPRVERADDRGDRRAQGGGRHARRRLRGHRARRARSASAATCSGTASSTAGSRRR